MDDIIKSTEGIHKIKFYFTKYDSRLCDLDDLDMCKHWYREDGYLVCELTWPINWKRKFSK